MKFQFVYYNNKEQLFAKINQLDPTRKWSVSVIEWKHKRSLQQNKWIRAYAADFGKHFGYDADFAYDLLMYKFNPVFKTDLDGNEIRVGGHFSKLNTKEAAEVQEAILIYSHEHGFFWDE